jgi:hypothetical protein
MAISVTASTSMAISVVAVTTSVLLQGIVELLLLWSDRAIQNFGVGLAVKTICSGSASESEASCVRRVVLCCSFLQSVADIAFCSKFDHVRIFSWCHRQSQCFRQGIFFGFLDPSDLLLSLTCSFGGMIFVVGSFGISFSIPGQITSLLPAPDWCHQRVAQIVLPVRRRLDIRPFEVSTATS